VGHFAGFWKFCSRPSLCETPPERQAPDTLVAMRAQPSSSAYLKKSKVESLAELDKLEKNDRDTSKDKQLAFAVFAALTPHCQPPPKNGLRHFSALPTHHPTSGWNFWGEHISH